MVLETQNGWRCKECGLVYKDKNWAEKCEDWCRENNSCNLEIIQHSINQTKE